jgi:hypothetical protein
MKSRFTLDPREVHEYVAKLDPGRELVHRLALRGLCDRCRSDDAFTQRTSSRCGSGMISARCRRRPRGSREIWQDTDRPKERRRGRATFSPSAALAYLRGDGRLYVDAEDCRAKARELREMARATDPSDRSILLVMARQYDWLARQIEARERGPEKP